MKQTLRQEAGYGLIELGVFLLLLALALLVVLTVL